MNNSRLPIDICEQIIDACCYFTWNLEPDPYLTWCRCALVCSAWRPRSQFNLLFEVVFTRAAQVALLTRTLLHQPDYANLVYMVRIGYAAGYIPFAHPQFPRLLRNCAALDLCNIDWSFYPPRYADIGLYSWKGVIKLSIALTPYTTTSILRYIWSLPMLRDLIIHCYRREGFLMTAATTVQRAANMPPDPCKELRYLAIHVRLDCHGPS